MDTVKATLSASVTAILSVTRRADALAGTAAADADAALVAAGDRAAATVTAAVIMGIMDMAVRLGAAADRAMVATGKAAAVTTGRAAAVTAGKAAEPVTTGKAAEPVTTGKAAPVETGRVAAMAAATGRAVAATAVATGKAVAATVATTIIGNPTTHRAAGKASAISIQPACNKAEPTQIGTATATDPAS